MLTFDYAGKPCLSRRRSLVSSLIFLEVSLLTGIFPLFVS